jgi:hypothetical protein
MEKKHRGWLRPVLAIGVLGALTGATLASPVSAHFVPSDERKHVKKIAKRIAKKEATTIVQTTVGPTLFIEEDELIRFSAQMNQGAADQTLATVGPFTIRGACDDDGANFDAFIEITTSESNSILDSPDGDDDTDFDTGETRNVLSYQNAPDGGAPAIWNGGGVFHAASPSGTYIQGPTTIFVNFDGSDCTFVGTISKVAPA